MIRRSSRKFLGRIFPQRLEVPATEPRATAMWDHFEQGKPTSYLRIREDGFRQKISTRQDFEPTTRLARLEERALDRSRGKILDAGAGSGRNSLILQERGADVTALDISSRCVALMRRRGVQKTIQEDIFELREGSFDTILLLMHGIGVAGTLEGLENLLTGLRQIINPGGRLMLDSYDFVYGCPGIMHDRYREQKKRKGQYMGEYRSKLLYKNLLGEPFYWLYIDPYTLEEYAERTGWKCEIPIMEDSADFLAELTPYKM